MSLVAWTISRKYMLSNHSGFQSVNEAFHTIYHKKFSITLSMILITVLTFITSTYLLYPPSLGNDTWRDINWSLLILKDGKIKIVLSKVHPAAIVPILYSILSLMTSLNPVIISCIYGLVYLICLTINVLLISRMVSGYLKRYDTFTMLFQILALLTIPHVSLWSIGFIPQALSVLMILTSLIMIMSRSMRLLAIIPVILTMTFSHPGQALIYLGYLAFSSVLLSVVRGKCNEKSRFAKRMNAALLLSFTTFAIYVTYTILITHIIGGYKNIVQASFTALGLEKSALQTFQKEIMPGNPLATALLGYGSIAMLVSLGTIDWLSNVKLEEPLDILREAGLSYGLTLIMLAYIAGALVTMMDAVRYLGLLGYIMLGAYTGPLFRRLYGQSPGKILVSFMMLLVISGIFFNGTLRVDINPFNSGTYLYIGSPPTWDDRVDVSNIVTLTSSLNTKILTDYRTMLMITNMHLYRNLDNFEEIVYESSYIHNYIFKDHIIKLASMGTYGFRASKDEIISFIGRGYYFILRGGALDKMHLLLNTTEKELAKMLVKAMNRPYDSKLKIYTYH
ncbi:MAG: hypothetical protein J7K59_07655 [Candidatus Korarchaeota archaeon]|nr:hypothetical protein [Candidatus Korarchaeota archaeon]